MSTEAKLGVKWFLGRITTYNYIIVSSNCLPLFFRHTFTRTLEQPSIIVFLYSHTSLSLSLSLHTLFLSTINFSLLQIHK